MLRRLFQRSREAAAAAGGGPLVDGEPPRLPAGVRVYAVGDVHGRVDLLQKIERRIAEDAEAAPPGLDRIVVYVGDYVDRGFESRKVLDHLIARPLHGFTPVHLLGNHDAWLRDFLRGHDVGGSWVRAGGDATLVSYGVKLDLGRPEEERLEEARARLRERVPAEHEAFLHGLELAFGLGDYFFCHAGVRPGVPLELQTETDLCWIREPFLSWGGSAGKVVVHGHTVEERPVVRPNRIGIDTGACWTGNLTCLVLEGGERRFLSTLPVPVPPPSARAGA